MRRKGGGVGKEVRRERRRGGGREGEETILTVELTVCLISQVLSWLLVVAKSSTSAPSGK